MAPGERRHPSGLSYSSSQPLAGDAQVPWGYHSAKRTCPKFHVSPGLRAPPPSSTLSWGLEICLSPTGRLRLRCRPQTSPNRRGLPRCLLLPTVQAVQQQACGGDPRAASPPTPPSDVSLGPGPPTSPQVPSHAPRTLSCPGSLPAPTGLFPRPQALPRPSTPTGISQLGTLPRPSPLSHVPGVPTPFRALWLSWSAQGPGPRPRLATPHPPGTPSVSRGVSPVPRTCPASRLLLPAQAKSPAASLGPDGRGGPGGGVLRGLLGHGVLARRPGDAVKCNPGPRSSLGNVVLTGSTSVRRVLRGCPGRVDLRVPGPRLP